MLTTDVARAAVINSTGGVQRFVVDKLTWEESVRSHVSWAATPSISGKRGRAHALAFQVRLTWHLYANQQRLIRIRHRLA